MSRPVDPREEECSLLSFSSESYFSCLKQKGIKLFSSPTQSITTWVLIIIALILIALWVQYGFDLPYFKVNKKRYFF